MPGKSTAVSSGTALQDKVVAIGEKLGLDVQTEVKVGRRIWGRERHIDVVLTDKKTQRSIGLECKYQAVGGTAEEKIPATIKDIKAWPIRGLVIFEGVGFSQEMRGYLLSTGMAVELEDLEVWLRLFFGMPPA
jgi:galactitol-specific phosphotransferase system IIB component